MFEEYPAAPASQPRWLRRWFFRLFALAVVAALGYLGWIGWQVWQLRDTEPETTAFMQQALERLRERDPKAQIRYQWVPYERISVHLKRAVLAAEDQKFLQHEGFDWEAIEKAYQRNLESKRLRGGSTISQQLAKNLFLSGERTYLRKAQEALYTVALERLLSKRRILEIYLNVVEWGNGVYGAEAGSRQHFGVPAADLMPEEAAWLAAILPAPRRYTGGRAAEYVQRRSELILSVMNQMPAP
jgi:monofunctional biosynthetic peptidoglycan transglycosylase